eukprot:scaffold166419_cov36-Tisochrysis_lutea.AAC.3
MDANPGDEAIRASSSSPWWRSSMETCMAACRVLTTAAASGCDGMDSIPPPPSPRGRPHNYEHMYVHLLDRIL